MKEVNYIRPFRKMCMSIGAIPTSYLESMDYYEMLEWLCEFVGNDVIKVINKNGEILNDLVNYFDNLDVQEEINNKLDEMAESGELETLISDFIINGKGQVKYIFPSRTVSTTDYNIITGYGKNILIDTGIENEYQNLLNALASENITHLDILILSHYHNDHAGNFISLFDDGFIDENTILYLPKFNTSVWASTSAYQYYENIMAVISDNNLTFINPSERQQININSNFKLQFLNTNDTYYIDNNINSDYNNASMVVLLKHFGINALYMGDAYKHVLNKLSNDGSLPETIHIYKMGHHGIDNHELSIYNVIKTKEIKNAIQIIGLYDATTGKASAGGTITDLKSICNNIYTTCYNNGFIKFSSFINSLNLVNGVSNHTTDNLNFEDVDIYVDSVNSNENYQDGSLNFPFKNLIQAIGYINKNNGINYTIHVKNGTYDIVDTRSLYVPTISGCMNTINIIGESSENTILSHGFKINNCQNVKISNFKIVNKMVARTFNITNSNVEISNIDYDKDESVDKQYFLYCEKSNVVIENCEIKNANYGIYEVNSNVSAYMLTFSGIASQCLYGNGGKFVRSDNIVVTDSSVSHGREYGNPAIFEKGLLLFSGEGKYSTGNITNLLARCGRFDEIEIEFSVNSYKRSERFKMSGGNVVCGLNDLFVANDGKNYVYSVALQVGDNYNANFNYSRKSTTDRTSGAITFNNNVDSLIINKIIGH